MYYGHGTPILAIAHVCILAIVHVVLPLLYTYIYIYIYTYIQGAHASPPTPLLWKGWLAMKSEMYRGRFSMSIFESRTLFDDYFWNGEQRAIQLSCRTLWVWIANAGPSVVMCSGQLWCGRGDVGVRVWFCVGVCLCLSVILVIERWKMRLQTRLLMSSGQLWRGRGEVCARVWFVWVYVCVCLAFWLLKEERLGCRRGYAPFKKL